LPFNTLKPCLNYYKSTTFYSSVKQLPFGTKLAFYAFIETEVNNLSGRIVGEFDENFILGFDIAIVWGL